MFEGVIKNARILAGELESLMALSGDVFVNVSVYEFVLCGSTVDWRLGIMLTTPRASCNVKS